MKVSLGLLALAVIFLVLAAGIAILARSSPEASYTPIVPVTVILVAFVLASVGMPLLAV